MLIFPFLPGHFTSVSSDSFTEQVELVVVHLTIFLNSHRAGLRAILARFGSGETKSCGHALKRALRGILARSPASPAHCPPRAALAKRVSHSRAVKLRLLQFRAQLPDPADKGLTPQRAILAGVWGLSALRVSTSMTEMPLLIKLAAEYGIEFLSGPPS
jgi:hypothetical protein